MIQTFEGLGKGETLVHLYLRRRLTAGAGAGAVVVAAADRRPRCRCRCGFVVYPWKVVVACVLWVEDAV